MRILATAVLATSLVASAPAVLAADTTTFNVRISITKACTITAAAATDVDFGTVSSTATGNTDAAGSVTAQCTALTPYTIALNAGVNPGTANDVTTRRMRNTDTTVTTNNLVPYQLYQDSARTQVWGSTAGNNVVSGSGNGANQTFQVFGRVANPSLANAAAGSYQDTVTATITY